MSPSIEANQIHNPTTSKRSHGQVVTSNSTLYKIVCNYVKIITDKEHGLLEK